MRLKTIDNWFNYIGGWHSYTFTTKIAVDTTKMDFVQVCRLSLISITILCVSFTNSATVGRLEQVQLCNRLIDQSADNITGLKCAKECLILKYKYIQNPWLYFTERILRWAHFLRSSIITTFKQKLDVIYRSHSRVLSLKWLFLVKNGNFVTSGCCGVCKTLQIFHQMSLVFFLG